MDPLGMDQLGMDQLCAVQPLASSLVARRGPSLWLLGALFGGTRTTQASKPSPASATYQGQPNQRNSTNRRSPAASTPRNLPYGTALKPKRRPAPGQGQSASRPLRTPLQATNCALPPTAAPAQTALATPAGGRRAAAPSSAIASPKAVDGDRSRRRCYLVAAPGPPSSSEPHGLPTATQRGPPHRRGPQPRCRDRPWAQAARRSRLSGRALGWAIIRARGLRGSGLE